MKTILDPSFRYTPSFATNLRQKFEKMRREQKLSERRARNEQLMQEAQARLATQEVDTGPAKLICVK